MLKKLFAGLVWFTWLAIPGYVLGQGEASLPAVNRQGSPMLVRHEGKAPRHGLDSVVVQGEVVYTEFDYANQKAARLLEDAKVTKSLTLAKGTVLLGFSARKEARYCWYDANARALGIPAPGWACLVPGQNDRFVARYLLASGALRGRRKGLKHQPAFELTEVLLDSRYAVETGTGDLFRKEIVYQGAANGVLRLLYREYTNDMARPAFSQELTYDLADNGSLTLAVKGARLEVMAAGNAGIRYRVKRGFDG